MAYTRILVLTIFLCSITAQADGLKKVSFRPQWVPQSQFAGYYVAKERGFYKEAGLDVTILSGGPAIHGLVDVASKKTTFCTDLLMAGLVLSNKGAPIVNIGQFHQTTGLMLISYKNSGIDSPQKMVGKNIGVWPGMFEIPPSVFAKKYGIKVTNVQQGFDMNLFLKKKIDVASAMVYNEYFIVLDSGVKAIDLNTFHYQDHGLNFPDDGVYAHRDTCKNDPKLCALFIAASRKGWQWAFANIEKATDIVMTAANAAKTNTTRKHQLRMLKETKKIITYKNKGKKMGHLDEQDFKNVVNHLISTKKISQKNKLSYEKFHWPASQKIAR